MPHPRVEVEKLKELSAIFEHDYHQNRLSGRNPLENQVVRLQGLILLAAAAICERLEEAPQEIAVEQRPTILSN